MSFPDNCPYCKSRKIAEIFEGVLKYNRKGNLVDYDPHQSFGYQCRVCGEEIKQEGDE